MFDKRLNALRELMAREGLECVALVPGANLFYFTGLRKSMSERPIVAFVPLEGPPCLVLPVIEAPEARAALTFEMEMVTYSDEEGHLPAFRRVCGELGLAGRRLGVEYLTMRVMERALIEQCTPGVQLANADGLFSELRIIKDATEIAAMRQAARLNEQAYARLREHIVPGRTEKELAALLRIAAWEVGAEGIAFDPIIVAGLNSASPHSHPGDHVLQTFELVIVDFGVTYGGYCSDITRTYATWRVSPEMASVHRAVYEANAAARAAVRPGVTAQEVDRVARRVIAEAGYGEYFVHRTGHGLGLEVHEAPYIVEGNELVLRPGMVFTIEPGVYVPGLGGARIEDNVVVTETGCETLTNLSRELGGMVGH